jgi:hypothetical protein
MKKTATPGYSQGRKLIIPGSNVVLVLLTQHTADNQQKQHLFYMHTNGERYISDVEKQTRELLPKTHWDTMLNTKGVKSEFLLAAEHIQAVALAQKISEDALYGFTVGDMRKPRPVLSREYIVETLGKIFGPRRVRLDARLAY